MPYAAMVRSQSMFSAVKVVDTKLVVDRPKGPRGPGTKVAECIIGDSTAAIVFSARDDQGALRVHRLLHGIHDA